MDKYTSEDNFNLKDRGRVYVVRALYDYKFGEAPMINKTVLIDGNAYKVKDVESHCLSIIRKGTQIGLLV